MWAGQTSNHKKDFQCCNNRGTSRNSQCAEKIALLSPNLILKKKLFEWWTINQLLTFHLPIILRANVFPLVNLDHGWAFTSQTQNIRLVVVMWEGGEAATEAGDADVEDKYWEGEPEGFASIWMSRGVPTSTCLVCDPHQPPIKVPCYLWKALLRIRLDVDDTVHWTVSESIDICEHVVVIVYSYMHKVHVFEHQVVHEFIHWVS